MEPVCVAGRDEPNDSSCGASRPERAKRARQRCAICGDERVAEGDCRFYRQTAAGSLSLEPMASGSPSVIYVIAKAQIVMMIILAYQIYLALGTEMVDEALKGVERFSSWPIQALNSGLFVLVLWICWLYRQRTRKDPSSFQEASDEHCN